MLSNSDDCFRPPISEQVGVGRPISDLQEPENGSCVIAPAVGFTPIRGDRSERRRSLSRTG